jgi:hypothetical protein
MNIDISRTEMELLHRVLSDRLSALRQEVRHTDARPFKDDLKDKEQVLKQLISKLSS